MILCLDIGNSHLLGGVIELEKGTIQLRFRYTSRPSTSDELGIFLKAVLRENTIDVDVIDKIAICSVVPNFDYSIRAACMKYFSIEPFMLQAGVKTGLKIKYRNPIEVGADRIANAIAAYYVFPNKNVIIIDFGTATTFCAISADKEYLGGVIMPGIRLSMDALQQKTAKLPPVEILRREQCVGRSTVESIQSGLYFGTLGAVREIIHQISAECFANSPPVIIGTGGFAQLYDRENIFHIINQDLVLLGLYHAFLMND